MKPSTLLVSFLYVGASLAQIPPLSSLKNSNLPGNIVRNQFIVEVDDLYNIPTKRAFRRVSLYPERMIKGSSTFQSLDAVYEALRDCAVELEILDEFHEPNIFVGAAVAVKVCLLLP